ncbi:MAG: type II toxin-antitoxin system Phd/YefM family antitoxin [Deltaproteobacteria bacterium]|nr:type II toxin-antitoxin system Phd/YefM family antitoxin [Deltaproteobacteria bacterium]
MQKQFSIAEAKNRLPSIIHYVEKGPYVKLTRRGKPVAVLLSIQAYEQLSRKYTGFWNAVSNFRKKIDDEGIEISDGDFKGLRDISPGREVELK